MSYLCGECRFSFIVEDACDTFNPDDVDQCTTCLHGETCHPQTRTAPLKTERAWPTQADVA